MVSFRCRKLASSPIIHDLFCGLRDVVWQGCCLSLCFCSKSRNRAHEVNKILSILCGFISNASRQYFCIGANPRVSKNPSFPDLVFFSWRLTSGIDTRYSFQFFLASYFYWKNIFLAPKAQRCLFLIYLQLQCMLSRSVTSSCL